MTNMRKRQDVAFEFMLWLGTVFFTLVLWTIVVTNIFGAIE